MLRQMLKDDTGFISNERVAGALFKKNIKDIPDRAFSSSGMNKLISGLGIYFHGICYVNNKGDVPCMYGQCHILGDNINVESQFSWVDFKRIKHSTGGVFSIEIDMDNDTSFLPRMRVHLTVDNLPLDALPMSPVLAMLNPQS